MNHASGVRVARPAARSRLFQTALWHPRRLWLRRALFQVHLWSGLLAALYIVLIGASGSLLVFKEELMPKPRVAPPPVDLRACTPGRLVQVVERVNQLFPKKEAFLTACPQQSNPFFLTTLRDRPENGSRGGRLAVYSHPASGAVVGSADREGSWVHWLDELHANLLLGRSGRVWNGAGAAILLLLGVSGVALWWPGIGGWRRALRVDLRAGWRRVNWDLHGAGGIWTLAFTLTWALTGIYFAWPAAFSAAVSKLSPVVSASYPAAQLSQHTRGVAARDRPLDVLKLLERARRESPDGALEGYFLGSGARPVFTVYMARGRMGDYANTDFVYFDQRSGEHLYTWHRGRNQTLGDWLIWLAAPLHFGTSWGRAVQWLWCGLGLSLPLLAVTGCILYWNRYLSRRMPGRGR